MNRCNDTRHHGLVGGLTRRGVATALTLALLLHAPLALAAEVPIDDSVGSVTSVTAAGANTVFTDGDTGYVFYVDSTNDVAYRKTTDGGASWGDPVIIDGATPAVSWLMVAVWYDRWTPGGTGGKIHIAASDLQTGFKDTWYHSLDTAGDTLRAGGWVAVVTDGDIASLYGGPSVVRATDGHLFVAGASGTSPYYHVYASTDGGATWGTTAVGTTTNGGFYDRAQLLPLSGGDVLMVRQVTLTAGDLRANVYDGGAGTWGGWSDVDTDWAAGIGDLITWSAAVDKATGDVYLAGNNDPGTSTADIRVKKFDDGDRAWSSLTNVESNSAAMAGAAIMIDENTGDLHVVYGMGTSYGNSINVYARASEDGGASWGDATQLNSTTDDIKVVYGSMTSSARLYATWYNEDLSDLLGQTAAALTPPGLGQVLRHFFFFFGF